MTLCKKKFIDLIQHFLSGINYIAIRYRIPSLRHYNCSKTNKKYSAHLNFHPHCVIFFAKIR